MAQDKKVEQITSMEDDFAQWYTDICKKAELIDYSSVKGFMILRPYGYAIWENIQRIMDGEFKKTGHENVAMPALIPESLLKKEGELVNGFAPEVAWVTMGGSDKLEERLRELGFEVMRGDAPSCAAGNSGGRRATPSTRPPRRLWQKRSSSSTAMLTSAATRWPCR